jgi:hypothetical protein
MITEADQSRKPPWRELLLVRCLPALIAAIAWMLALADLSNGLSVMMLAIAFIGAPILTVVLSSVAGPRREASIRYRRRMAGECVFCGYSLRGNVSGRCPECGQLVSESATD